MATQTEIAKALAILAAGYPSFQLTKETVGVYCTMLRDLRADLLEASVKHHMSKSRFFPTISELREAAAELAHGESQSLSGPEAWAEIRSEMSRVGYVGTPELSSSLVVEAIRCVGGWRYLCGSDNGVSDRARFIQAYETLQKREKLDAMTLPQLRPGTFKLLEGGKK